MLRVGFLGPVGTYSYQAACEFYGNEAEYVPFETISKVLDSLKFMDNVVVPFENSSFGLVSQTIDYFRELSPDHTIHSEMYLRIDHHLLSKTTLEKVKVIYSHPAVILTN